MNFGDHAPPHSHVRFAGISASVAISPLVLTEGDLPRSAWDRARLWAESRQTELLTVWAEYGGAEARG